MKHHVLVTVVPDVPWVLRADFWKLWIYQALLVGNLKETFT